MKHSILPPLYKSPSILLITVAIIMQHVTASAYAWEDWEQRLINNNCLNYSERNIDNEYLRCFRIDLTNINGGDIIHVTRNKKSVSGCASNKGRKWCEIALLNKNNQEVLRISINNFGADSTSVVIDEYNLGDKCSCKVDEWAIETDTSVFHEHGLWTGKESFPIIIMLRKAKSLSIYATIPNKYKTMYRSDFLSNELSDFQSNIEQSLRILFNNK
jgi:hypothetical protein